ncbi:MAG: vWA domain-containing protein [Thermoguttaceae bacterium]
MIFGSPYWLFLLIPLAAVIGLRAFFFKRNGVVFSSIGSIKKAPRTLLQFLKYGVDALPYFVIALLILALARPQSDREEYRTQTEGIAIMMCIDRSGSMQAVDFTLGNRYVTRLDVVKKTFQDFVQGTETLSGRAHDKIGLIAFGGFADSFCPLTLDHDTLVEMLGMVQLPAPVLDGGGRGIGTSFLNEERLTAIGDALIEAVDRLKTVSAKSKVIILLSDGEQTTGIATPLEGAKAAKAFGIKVYVIGIGSTGDSIFITKDRFGHEFVSYQPVVLDERTLLQIAQETGGEYFNAQNAYSLNNIYERIDQLEKSEQEGLVYTKYSEKYYLFLYPAIFLFFIYILLNSTRFRTLG